MGRQGRRQTGRGLKTAVTAQPIVSVVIATHNRPEPVRRLLEAVAAQDLTQIEAIVVDDGSQAEAWAAVQAAVAALGPRFRAVRNEIPQGPSAARNRGVQLASGRFVAFCDDDDLWTRDDHLSSAVAVLEASGLDLFFGEMLKVGPDNAPAGLWFAPRLDLSGAVRLDGGDDLHRLTESHLAGFLGHRILHANTLVIRRTLFEGVKGYWEKIRFAEDHDFALRLSDAAGAAAFRSTPVAQIDVSPHQSLSRRFDAREQLLMSSVAVLHAESEMRRAAFRRVARRNRAHRLTELADLDLAAGEIGRARAFAFQAFVLAPSKSAVLALLRAWRGRAA